MDLVNFDAAAWSDKQNELWLNFRRPYGAALSTVHTVVHCAA